MAKIYIEENIIRIEENGIRGIGIDKLNEIITDKAVYKLIDGELIKVKDR